MYAELIRWIEFPPMYSISQITSWVNNCQYLRERCLSANLCVLHHHLDTFCQYMYVF